VRGLAILLVLVGHALFPRQPAASVGVTLFFVLSGFLITSLIWEEIATTGRVGLVAFYRRRIRRLLPAFAVVSVATFVSMVAIGQAAQGFVNGVIAATYLSNWVMASGQWLGPLSHTWSLAIEEQFYILWPIALLLGVKYLRPSRLIWLLIVGIVAVEIGRAAAWAGGLPLERQTFGTDLQADGLLLGCVLAIVMHRRPLQVPGVAGPLALGLLFFVAFLLPGGLYTSVGNATAVLASGLLVTVLVSSERTDPIFHSRWLGGLGLISYGLYLWHYPIMWHLGFDEQRPYPGLMAAAIGIVLSLAAAGASYIWVERRFRRSSGNRRSDPHSPEAETVPELGMDGTGLRDRARGIRRAGPRAGPVGPH
jgi:peptidoglycan/LPS O-acetylase OafA/YrhL